MKTTINIFKVLIVLFISTTLSTAQNQHYRIHVDHVYPSSSEAYGVLAKKLADMAKENKEEDSWNILWTYDNRVFTIAPMNGWEDMSKPFLPNTREEMGNEKFAELFEEFDKHYDDHNDYMIHLSGNLSYLPEEANAALAGKNYRKILVMYYKARDGEKLREVAKKFKDLYTQKQSKSYYRFYFSGFGNPESYVMVVSAAENQLEYAKQSEANRKLMGEEAEKLWNELSQYITKIEYVEGEMQPELSYNPN
ncbi:MAG TPA: hypothetical protein VFF15_01875 [Flavobacteriaceae bacterium]|nr:hypothetical protein [Flavobacteriaceae bacterium]